MDIGEAFYNAERLLEEHGFLCAVSAEEFKDWFGFTTAYSDIGLDDVLRRPLLAAHEIVEIAEVKRMGIPVTKDVIRRRPDLIYEAHLKAFEVELQLAEGLRDWSHIRGRLLDVQSWLEDPLLPPKARPRCEDLLKRTKELLTEG